MNLTNHLRALVDSVNAEDTEGPLDSFTDDALADDDGRQHRGLLQLAEWNTRQVIGPHARLRNLSDHRVGDDVELLVEGGSPPAPRRA
ncbi:hypothetical protein [Kineococcus arenarius]|uniref:hypothetical protein n=1 Tax=unclassified Kineococcus TaxID=2621656 RepID=UPI003D7D8FB6